jgi:hypothetical protein
MTIATMSVNLYRRHFRTPGKCIGGYERDSRHYETDELRRGWKKCRCPIYAAGTLGGKFNRRNTRQSTWSDAKAIAARWETADSWDTEKPTEPSQPTAANSNTGPGSTNTTIERAIAALLAEHSAPNTLRKCRTIMDKLKAYSATKGYVLLEQWGPIDVREFRTAWRVSPTTAAKNLSLVKSFFEFALSNEWIARNPARLVKNPRGRAGGDTRNEQRNPFSDEELNRMFEASESLYGKRPIRWSRTSHHHAAEPGMMANYRYKWTGRDLADFIAISVYTGLRISDVSTFDAGRLEATGECSQPPLPPDPPLRLEGLQQLLEQANQAVGRLDRIASVLPDLSLFIYAYVRKEAVVTSQIEGTQSSFRISLCLKTMKCPAFPFTMLRRFQIMLPR